jgi:hypothetical protein
LNVLTSAYTQNYLTTISGLWQTFLSPTELKSFYLVPFTIPSGSYVGLNISFGMNIMVDRIELLTNTTSDIQVSLLDTSYSGTQISADGTYNLETNYSTPRMQDPDYPSDYHVGVTTSWDSSWYGGWKAFNQTNNDSMDCWFSGQGSSGYPPQSIMFKFANPKIINKYALQARNHATAASRCFPSSFLLQGNIIETPTVSGDLGWITLDVRSSVADPGQANWSSYFTFDNSKAYQYYRLKVLDQTDGSQVGIANVKLVEAYKFENVDIYTDQTISGTATASGFVFYSSEGAGLAGIKLMVRGINIPITISGMSVLSNDNKLQLGFYPTVSGSLYESFLFDTQSTLPVLIPITNQLTTDSKIKLLFQYTNIYDLDKNIFLSLDYTRQPNPTWYGIEHGLCYPETQDFGCGRFYGTELLNNSVVLSSSGVMGSWRSPIIDTKENSLSYGYLYYDGTLDIYTRSSDTAPPSVYFLVITTETTHRWLMYDHKRVFLDSHGDVVGEVICDSPADGNKIWRTADFGWEDHYLMYYGTINNRGTASFLAPGYTTCGDLSPEQEFLNSDYWYNLNVCKLSDTSLWNTGTSISGMVTGVKKSVVFTKTFPVDRSDGFFCFTIVTDFEYYITTLYLSFSIAGKTLLTSPILNYSGIVSSSSRVDVAFDYANSGWWVYIYPYIYKVDPGSLENVVYFDPDDERIPPETYGYIWKLDPGYYLKGLVSIPYFESAHFWGFTDSLIYLFEEVYVYEDPEFSLIHTVDTGVQLAISFEELHAGSCDAFGNLWMLDIVQERLIRVNFAKAMQQSSECVDYENVIPGALGIWAHPYDGTCYVLIGYEPEHYDQDIIRMYYANQRWGSRGKYVCSVPGFCSKDHKWGVQFFGKAFTDGVTPHENSAAWGRAQKDGNGTTNISTNYATPKMLSNQVPTPFIVHSTSEGGGSSSRQAWRAFNQQTDALNGWQINSSSLPHSIMFVFDEAKVINKYSLAIMFDSSSVLSNFPASWELQRIKPEYASEPDVFNDLQWVGIDSRSGISRPSLIQLWTSYFSFSNTYAAIAYRLKILSGTNGNASVALGEIKLVEAEERIPWLPYTSGSALPRGRYKQLRADFKRNSTAESSPKLNKIRLPEPIISEYIDPNKDLVAAVKTTFGGVRMPGSWAAKLNVWLTQE